MIKVYSQGHWLAKIDDHKFTLVDTSTDDVFSAPIPPTATEYVTPDAGTTYARTEDTITKYVGDIAVADYDLSTKFAIPMVCVRYGNLITVDDANNVVWFDADLKPRFSHQILGVRQLVPASSCCYAVTETRIWVLLDSGRFAERVIMLNPNAEFCICVPNLGLVEVSQDFLYFRRGNFVQMVQSV